MELSNFSLLLCNSRLWYFETLKFCRSEILELGNSRKKGITNLGTLRIQTHRKSGAQKFLRHRLQTLENLNLNDSIITFYNLPYSAPLLFAPFIALLQTKYPNSNLWLAVLIIFIVTFNNTSDMYQQLPNAKISIMNYENLSLDYLYSNRITPQWFSKKLRFITERRDSPRSKANLLHKLSVSISYFHWTNTHRN